MEREERREKGNPPSLPSPPFPHQGGID